MSLAHSPPTSPHNTSRESKVHWNALKDVELKKKNI